MKEMTSMYITPLDAKVSELTLAVQLVFFLKGCHCLYLRVGQNVASEQSSFLFFSVCSQESDSAFEDSAKILEFFTIKYSRNELDVRNI